MNGRSGMGWDGMGWDGMGWDGINYCIFYPIPRDADGGWL